MLNDSLYRLRALFRRKSVETELDDELRAHLEHQVEKYVQSGLPVEEAKRRAKLEFGGVDQVREECRDARGVRFIETTLQDVRYGLRTLVKRPAFSVLLVLVLALGIGSTTAIFTVMDGVLLKPPFKHADRLVLVRGAGEPPTGDTLAWWGQGNVFASLAVYRSGGVNVAGGASPQRVPAAVVSASFLSIFEANPHLGRAFAADEETPDHNRVALLSYRFWVQNFGGNPKALGQSVNLNGIPHTIIGVMAPGFGFPGHTDVWVPRAGRGLYGASRDLDLGSLKQADLPLWNQEMLGRLQEGVTVAQAHAALTTLLHRLTDTYTAKTGIEFGDSVDVVPLQEEFVRNSRPALLALFTGVCFLLLLACVNAANMLLARAAVRQKEVAVRLCLGAGAGRVARQLLTESVLAASLAGSLGVLLAYWIVAAVRTLGPADIPRLAEVGVDARALAFALGVSLVTGMAIGVVPAFQSVAPDLTRALKDEGLSSASGLRQRLRSALVVLQVALALVLVAGAGLMLQTFRHLTEVEPGFDSHHVLTAQLDLPAAKYSPPSPAPLGPGGKEPSAARPQGPATGAAAPNKEDRARRKAGTEQSSPEPALAFQRNLLERVETLPGVRAAGLISALPLSGRGAGGQWFDFNGKRSVIFAFRFSCAGDYFRAMGIPLMAGRAFTDRDIANAASVIIVSRTFARQLWGDSNPVGQRILIEGETAPREIVGVVEDVKYWGLGDAPERQFYLPWKDRWDMPWKYRLDMTLVVRTAADPTALRGSVESEIRSLDKDLPVFHVKSMDEVMSESIASPRFRGLLLGICAFLALLLAALGVYGVIAYSVACRSHEMAVRLSLGAQPTEIVLLVLGQGIRLVLSGVALGLAAALGLNRLVSGLLFGVSAYDPATLAWSALTLAGAALVACAVPALRAGKSDPMAALRYE